MLFIDLFRQKLKEQLLKELEHVYPEIDLDQLIEQKINEIDIEDKIRSRLPIMIKERRNNNEDLCCGRVWSNHYGNRCSRNKINDHYCSQHQNMIDKYGYLSLGRINDQKPTLNEDGKSIPWYEYEILDMINIIFEYISVKLIK